MCSWRSLAAVGHNFDQVPVDRGDHRFKYLYPSPGGTGAYILELNRWAVAPSRRGGTVIVADDIDDFRVYDDLADSGDDSNRDRVG